MTDNTKTRRKPEDTENDERRQNMLDNVLELLKKNAQVASLEEELSKSEDSLDKSCTVLELIINDLKEKSTKAVE